MTLDLAQDNLPGLLRELIKLPHETEWVEFKQNNDAPMMIGEYISALANSAARLGKQSAWLVWGVADADHDIVGTRFNPATARHKMFVYHGAVLMRFVPHRILRNVDG